MTKHKSYDDKMPVPGVSAKQIERLIEIYKDFYGQRLTTDEAEDLARRLIILFSHVDWEI